MQNYDTLKTLPVTQTEESKLSLNNTSPEDIPTFGTEINVLTRVDPRKNNPTAKNDTFCNIILQHMHCNTNENYFTNATGILHKRVRDFNSTFSSVAIPKILIKYLLYASHNSLDHVGATKLYHSLIRLHYLQGMWKEIHQYIRSCKKCQIINLLKPHYINLHQDIAQMLHDHISIDLIGPYNPTAQGNSYTSLWYATLQVTL